MHPNSLKSKRTSCFLFFALFILSLHSQSNEFDIAPWYQWKTAAVVLTFDDWSADHPGNAIPEMNKFNIKGSFFINGWAFDMFTQELKDAIASGHEIANHTGLHKHLTQLSSSERSSQITGFQNEINNRLPTQNCITFSYPFGDGAGNNEVESIVSTTHIGARAVINQIWSYNFGGVDYYRMPAMTVRKTTTLNDIQSWVNEAISKQGLAIIMYHGMTGGSDDLSITLDQFKAHMSELDSRKSAIWVATFRDLLLYHKEANQAQLSLISQNNESWVWKLTDNLNNDTYNHPLSIKIKLLNDFTVASVTQGDQQIPYNVSDDFLYFEAIPDGGNIVVSTNNINPGKLSQQITFDQIPDKKTTDNSFSLTASASSGLPVSFSLLSGPATLSGNQITLTKKSGTVRIKASQSGNDQYLPSEDIVREFKVRKVAQEITFQDVGTKSVLDPAFEVEATSTSGLPVKITILSGPATLNGKIITLRGTAGTVEIEASQPGNATYLKAVNKKITFEVKKASQNIIMAALPDKSIDDNPFEIAVSTTSGLPATLEIVTGPATLKGTQCTLTGETGRVIVRATQSGNPTYTPAEDVVDSFEVKKLSQRITFPPISNKIFNDVPFDLGASSSSGLPVSFQVISGPATLEGNTITLTGKTGTVTVSAEQVGNNQYAPASAITQNFEVMKAGQQITFPQISAKQANSEPFNITATTTSGLPVTLEILQGPATLNDNVCTLNGVAGKVTMRASQSGSDQYLAAKDITQSFIINRADQTISFTPIENQQIDSSPVVLKATASSGLDVSFELKSGPASIEDNILTLSGDTGQVVVEAFQPGNETYLAAEPVQRSFRVNPEVQIISDLQSIVFDTIADQFVNIPYFLLLANASSGLNVDFEVLEGPATVNGDTCFLQGKTGTVSIRATQNGDENYAAAAPVVQQFEVKKLINTITLSAPTFVLTTDPPIVLELSSTAELPVSFEILSGPAKIDQNAIILDKIAGRIELVATQSGNELYEAAEDVYFNIDVNKAPQFIQFENITDQFLDQDSMVLQATTSSKLPVSFSIEQGPAYMNDSTIFFTGFEGNISVMAFQVGNETFLPAESVMRSFSVKRRTNVPTSLRDRPIVSSINTYPNPVRNQLYIELPNNILFPVEYAIIDLQGKIWKQNFWNNMGSDQIKSIDMKGSALGSYILLLSDPSGNRSRSLFLKAQH